MSAVKCKYERASQEAVVDVNAAGGVGVQRSDPLHIPQLYFFLASPSPRSMKRSLGHF